MQVRTLHLQIPIWQHTCLYHSTHKHIPVCSRQLWSHAASDEADMKRKIKVPCEEYDPFCLPVVGSIFSPYISLAETSHGSVWSLVSSNVITTLTLQPLSRIWNRASTYSNDCFDCYPRLLSRLSPCIWCRHQATSTSWLFPATWPILFLSCLSNTLFRHQFDVLRPCRFLVICGYFRALAAFSFDPQPWYAILNINQITYCHAASSYPPSVALFEASVLCSTYFNLNHTISFSWLEVSIPYNSRDPEMSAGYRDCIPETIGNHQIEVRAGSFRFTVSQTLGLDVRNGNEVILQYHLTSTPHPHAYALSALKTDPATRLEVSIHGQDSHGDFHCWLRATGECNLRKMNTLVEILKGYSTLESQGFGRRWFIAESLNRTSSDPPGRNRYTWCDKTGILGVRIVAQKPPILVWV